MLLLSLWWRQRGEGVHGCGFIEEVGSKGAKEEKGLMGVKETVRKMRRVRGGMVKRRGFQYRSENHLDMKGGLVIFCGD